MHGMPVPILAVIGIPDARQCLIMAGPFLVLAAAWWLVNHVEEIIDRLFPHWDWEKKMGWLNIRAEQRAEAVLRGIGYIIYALLAAALGGIVWGAQAMPAVLAQPDPSALPDLSLRLSTLLISAGLWLVYLGYGLIPKLRRQYENEELEKFRAEQNAYEQEQARLKAEKASAKLLPKSRLTARHLRGSQ